MGKFWTWLPWWGKVLLALAILAVLGVAVYLILKLIVLVVFGLFLGLFIWAYIRHQRGPGPVSDRRSEDYSDDDIDYGHADTTGRQGPVKRRNRMSQVKKCAPCKGTGDVGSYYYPKKCDVCNGTGYVSKPQTAVPCKPCKGTGKVFSPLRGTQLCQTCNGSGWATPPRR
jgi:DnaJ-class molecular chaperone